VLVQHRLLSNGLPMKDCQHQSLPQSAAHNLVHKQVPYRGVHLLVQHNAHRNIYITQ
jgi:hypothetical protein